MSLYVFRHGQTYDDIPGHERPSGWSNVLLTPEGVQRAHQTGKFLADKNIHSMFVSDLPRVLQTAAIIQSYTHSRIYPTPRLRAWQMGIYAGRPEDAVKPFLHYFKQHPDLEVPGGESYGASVRRFTGILNELNALASKHPEVNFAAGTHSHNTNMIPHILSGGRDPITLTDYTPDAGIVHITQDSNGRMQAEPIVVTRGEASA